MEEEIDNQSKINGNDGNNETLRKAKENETDQIDENMSKPSRIELENEHEQEFNESQISEMEEITENESIKLVNKASETSNCKENESIKILDKPSETSNCKDQEINGEEKIKDTDQTKHVTYSEHVDIILNDDHVAFTEHGDITENDEHKIKNNIACNEQEEINNLDNKKNYGAAISDPNFKRKVTFSNEIIVIAYNDDEDEEEDEQNQPIEDDFYNETIHDRSKGTLFGAPDSKLDEITVNYADRMVNSRNIFKTVSFSNEVTVIHDGNLLFTSDSHECIKHKTEKPSKVDKILTKLKKVVQKMEDKTRTHDGNRDQKVLGDAEQSKTCKHQVQVMNLNQKHVAFSDNVECIDNKTKIEMREPNLKKVTFSNEIIVIAYPYENDDEINFEDSQDYTDILGDKELLDQTKYVEIEDQTVDYAEKVTSNKNIFKTVSFSNEVTVIHDGNLMFRNDSNESVKENFDVNKQLECKE